LANPFRRGSRGFKPCCWSSKWLRHGGDVYVLCIASQKQIEREFFISDRTDLVGKLLTSVHNPVPGNQEFCILESLVQLPFCIAGFSLSTCRKYPIDRGVNLVLSFYSYFYYSATRSMGEPQPPPHLTFVGNCPPHKDAAAFSLSPTQDTAHSPPLLFATIIRIVVSSQG